MKILLMHFSILGLVAALSGGPTILSKAEKWLKLATSFGLTGLSFGQP